MSCIDNDLEFHGTKKGGRRKTARRAYVDTLEDWESKYALLLQAVNRSINYAKGGGISRPTIAGLTSRLETIKTTILMTRPKT